MIKGIFFDAAGILYRRAMPTADFALRLLQQEGFPVRIDEGGTLALEELRIDAVQGLADYDQFWHSFLSLRGVGRLKKRNELISRITAFSNDVLPVEGSAETLSILKQRGFILGIISDTIYPLEWKLERLRKAGVAHWIDIMACSTDLGLHKPDPAIYHNAMKQAHLAPEESAFVGHDPRELDGATQAGMLTVAVFAGHDARADHVCQAMHDLIFIPEFAAAIPAISP